MAHVHVSKDCKKHKGTVEWLRQYALKNDIRIRDLSHLTVPDLPPKTFMTLMRPSFHHITLFCIPSNHDFPYPIQPQPTLYELVTNQPTAFVGIGNSFRRLPFSAITEQMLDTMRQHSELCCICLEKKPANGCVICNVAWCDDCQNQQEGKIVPNYFDSKRWKGRWYSFTCSYISIENLWNEYKNGNSNAVLKCPQCRMLFLPTTERVINERKWNKTVF